MSNWLAILALCVPALHALLMGMIGYPLALRRPGGLRRFHRSGFTWWLVSLSVVLLFVLTSTPAELAIGHPAASDPTPGRASAAAALALVGCLTIETVGSALLRLATRTMPDQGSQRYNAALPEWAALPGAEFGLLAITAVLEEAVYRGVALTWLATDQGLSAPVAVAISAVAFGGAHWYYGARQVILKTFIGVVLGAAALYAGWFSTAVAHVALNTILVFAVASAKKRAFS